MEHQILFAALAAGGTRNEPAASALPLTVLLDNDGVAVSLNNDGFTQLNPPMTSTPLTFRHHRK